MTTAASDVLIVNPRAGGGAAHTVFRRIEHVIEEVVGEVDLHFTEGPNHATELAHAAAQQGARRILVCGGDGTVSEVVNGLMSGANLGERPVLVVLAGGTGGDLRKSLGLESVRETLELLQAGRIRTIDVGRVEARHVETDAPFSRHFVNVASFGLGGLVDRHVHAFSALGGRAAYGLATALALWGWKNPLIRMTIEGDHPLEVEMRAVTVAVANGRFFGGGMCIAPEARLDDGLFDVTILGDLRRRDLIRAASGLYGDDGLSHPGILSRQGVRVRAESDDRVLLDIDGEAIGCLPATFEIEAGALEVVAA